MTSTPVKHPVLPEHAVLFSDYVHHWQYALGLNDWRITVSETRTKRRVLALCHKVDLEQRLAVIRLGEHFDPRPVTSEEMWKLAFHEVAHIWLTELISTVKNNGDDIDAQRSQEHRIINVLEDLVAGNDPVTMPETKTETARGKGRKP